MRAFASARSLAASRSLGCIFVESDAPSSSRRWASFPSPISEEELLQTDLLIVAQPPSRGGHPPVQDGFGAKDLLEHRPRNVETLDVVEVDPESTGLWRPVDAKSVPLAVFEVPELNGLGSRVEWIAVDHDPQVVLCGVAEMMILIGVELDCHRRREAADTHAFPSPPGPHARVKDEGDAVRTLSVFHAKDQTEPKFEGLA